MKHRKRLSLLIACCLVLSTCFGLTPMKAKADEGDVSEGAVLSEEQTEQDEQIVETGQVETDEQVAESAQIESDDKVATDEQTANDDSEDTSEVVEAETEKKTAEKAEEALVKEENKGTEKTVEENQPAIVLEDVEDSIIADPVKYTVTLADDINYEKTQGAAGYVIPVVNYNPVYEYAAGETVTLVVQPSGYGEIGLAWLKVSCGDTEITTTKGSASPHGYLDTYTFTMPAGNVFVEALFSAATEYEDPFVPMDEDVENSKTGCIELTNSDENAEWTDGNWYVTSAGGWNDSLGAVETSVTTLSNGVTIGEDSHVNLILANYSELRIKKGITIGSGGSLTIWTQRRFTGKLIIDDVETGNAGIGGAGRIVINGGTIQVDSDITVNNITVNGGQVVANQIGGAGTATILNWTDRAAASNMYVKADTYAGNIVLQQDMYILPDENPKLLYASDTPLTAEVLTDIAGRVISRPIGIYVRNYGTSVGWDNGEDGCTYEAECFYSEDVKDASGQLSDSSYDFKDRLAGGDAGNYIYTAKIYKGDTLVGYGKKTIAFHKISVTMKVDGVEVTDKDDCQGNSYMPVTEGGGQTQFKSGSFFTSDTEFKIETTFENGYVIEEFTVDGEPVSGYTATITLNPAKVEKKEVVINFQSNTEIATVNLVVGSDHADVAEQICLALNENDNGIFDAVQNNGIISFRTQKARHIYDLVGDIEDVVSGIAHSMYEEAIDPAYLLYSEVGLKPTYESEIELQNESMNEHKGALTDNMNLYVYWFKVVKEINLSVTMPVCGTNVTVRNNENGGFAGQDNGAVCQSDFVEVGTVIIGSDGYNSFEGTIKGGQEYTVMLEPMPRFGFIESKDAVYIVNGEEIEDDYFGRLRVSLIAPHDWNDDGECTNCGEDGPSIQKHGILLSGQIGVNFFADLSMLTDEERSAATMEFTVNGKKQTDTFDASHTSTDVIEYFGFTCYVNSVQMADEITAVLHYGDNKTVTETYSVKKYVDYVNANPDDFTTEVKNLVNAMADYGHYAQPYLATTNHWTLGEKHFVMPGKSSYGNNDVETTKTAVDGCASNVTGVDDSQIDRVFFTLNMESETALWFRLTVKEGYTGTVTATVDGEAANCVKQKDGSYLIKYPGISASKLGDEYTFTVTAGGEVTIKASALSYVHMVLNSDSTAFNNDEAHYAVVSLYKYYEAAKDCIQQ